MVRSVVLKALPSNVYTFTSIVIFFSHGNNINSYFMVACTYLEILSEYSELICN